MVVEKRLQFGGPLTSVRELDDSRVCMIDTTDTVRFFSLDPIVMVGGFKTTVKTDSKLLHSSDTSHDGHFVAFSAKKEGAVVFHVEQKKLLYRFSRHDGEVESLKFAPKRDYLATGGQDGKTFLWSMVTGRMVASLPHHADFVRAIDFSPNGQWIATGSYDRKIFVTNVSSLAQGVQLKAHGGAINDLRFISGHRLLAGDKSGEIIVWDYYEGRLIKRLPKMLDEVRSLTTTPDDRFLFAADKTGIVALYDLQKYELLSLRYLTYAKPIRKIAYLARGNHLIVGLETNEVTFNSPLKEAENIDELIAEGRYGEAYTIAEENPLIRYSESFLRLEAIWEEAFEKARGLLEQGKTEEAKKVLEAFTVDRTKRLLLQELIRDYKEFAKFKAAVEAKRYPLAYSMAAQYPLLKEHPLYLKMEKEWDRLFAQAKKLVLQNGGEDKVREILFPFRGVPGKSALIQALIAEKEIYRLFMKVVAKGDYKAAMDLAKRYPALKELDEYKKIEKLADIIARKGEEALVNGEYAEAARYAEKLADFPDCKEEAEALKERANLYAQVMQLFAEKRYAAIYKLVETHPYLEETKIVKDLEEAWRRVTERAEKAAAEGDVAAIKRAVAPFAQILLKRPRIVALMKQAYIEQIEKAYEASGTIPDIAVERYLELFGYDDEIASWLASHKAADRFVRRAVVDLTAIDPVTLPDRLV